MKRKGFFARLLDLWRGIWGIRLRNAEARNAEAVYHNAVEEHLSHHARLKDAIARMVYLRNRLEAELKERDEDHALVLEALEQAARANEDERALALIQQRDKLSADVQRLGAELERLGTQTEQAKQGLHEVKAAVARLRSERDEMLARKAHALARRDAQAALQRLTDTGHLSGALSALQHVRDSILELEHSVDLDAETEAALVSDGHVSMPALRREAAEAAARRELSRLKGELTAPSQAAGAGPAVAKRSKGNGKPQLPEPLPVQS